MQVVRSVSQWSAGTSQTEDSIQRAYCSLIEEAENFVYIEVNLYMNACLHYIFGFSTMLYHVFLKMSFVQENIFGWLGLLKSKFK